MFSKKVLKIIAVLNIFFITKLIFFVKYQFSCCVFEYNRIYYRHIRVYYLTSMGIRDVCE